MKRAFVLPFLVLVGCRAGPAPIAVSTPAESAVWNDPDRRPFGPRPVDDAPTRMWDHSDQLVFRQVSTFFAAPSSREAIDVNVLDEVANSSWFTNRIGVLPMSPDDVASGACVDPPLDTEAPMTVESSKLDGVTPGLVVRSARGIKYLMKLDDVDQTPRPTAADAIASRIYYAAGYTTPCNRVVFFDRSRLHIKKNAQLKTWLGTKRPMRDEDVDLLLTRASRLADGRYRALASQWLPGEPIGPWRYEKTRSGDPNDDVPHEDRREIRALRLLAAWLDNTDARAQNTLDVWIGAGHETGWVRHALIDFSDCFGALWIPAERWRRMGHAYWIDFGLIAKDFVTLGLRRHPWEEGRFGPSGNVFGYYDIEHFEPEEWKMETPNAAFERMTEHDGAWMARILAQITDAHLQRAIRSGRLGSAVLEAELLRLLRGRRERILRRYLSRLSPLGLPNLRDHELCVRDLAVASGVSAARNYVARMQNLRLPVSVQNAEICVALPRDGGTLEIATADTEPLRIAFERGRVTSVER
jgi:hypothetical protein